MRHIFTIIILAFTLNGFGQYPYDKSKISAPTGQIVSRIAKVNELMGSAVYVSGTRPAQYDNFTELQNTATQDELLELTHHPKGVVRCYAFWALTYRPNAEILPMVIAHITDTEPVKTQFGCIGGREKVGDFYIDLVTPEYIDLDVKKLTADEHDYLDSLLVYSPNELDAKDHAITRIKPDEASYARIRELVVRENNRSALVTLARFKRKQDIPLILYRLKGEDQLYFTYQAISEFPDNAFLPFLQKSLDHALGEPAWSTEWGALYKAIASFKNDTALQLLKMPFTGTKHQDIRPYHINFIFSAVQEFYTPVYDEVLWTIWQDERKINTKVFNLLYQQNPEKAFQLTKMTLQNVGESFVPDIGNISDEAENTANLLDVMLDTVLARDKPYGIELINRNIRETDVFQFPTFANKAFELRDSSFVSSMFDRLQSEDNPHIYLKATQVLIALKDDEINRRISEIARINPALKKDWGGKAFAKLLVDNGIR